MLFRFHLFHPGGYKLYKKQTRIKILNRELLTALIGEDYWFDASGEHFAQSRPSSRERRSDIRKIAATPKMPFPPGRGCLALRNRAIVPRSRNNSFSPFAR